MEKTVERLEAMFQKADSDVNRMTQRLEFEFSNKDNKELQPNPAELAKRVQNVKTEYSALVEQIKAVDIEQKKALEECAGHLTDISQLLQTIQSRTGMTYEKPEELTRLEQFLDIELPWCPQSSESDTSVEANSQSIDKETPEENELAKNTK